MKEFLFRENFNYTSAEGSYNSHVSPIDNVTVLQIELSLKCQ